MRSVGQQWCRRRVAEAATAKEVRLCCCCRAAAEERGQRGVRRAALKAGEGRGGRRLERNRTHELGTSTPDPGTPLPGEQRTMSLVMGVGVGDGAGVMSVAVMVWVSMVTTSLPVGAQGNCRSTLNIALLPLVATAVIFLQDTGSGGRAGPHRATQTQ